MPEATRKLQVKTFGKFSLQYNGKSLLGQKNNQNQFVYLMQMVLHHWRTGISREAVEEALFEDRDVEFVHHALRCVVYNAKQRLEKLGLPKMHYILQKGGMLYWNSELEIEEDAWHFEELCAQAAQAESQDRRLEILLEASYCYGGEFLEMYTGILWVASESRRYRGLFCRCVEEAAEILRVRQDFIEMEKLGRHASKVAPFSDWEALTMEALIGMGRYEEADQLYADTVKSYFEERGLKPSQKLMETMNQMGSQFHHQHEVLGNIQQRLREMPAQNAPYVCNYPVFQGIYQMLNRLAARNGSSNYLMLCTIVDSNGNPMKNNPRLEEMAERLKDALRHSLRRSDIVNRYGSGQYLVLLNNISLENCQIVQKRINKFLQGRKPAVSVRYYMNTTFSEESLL